MEMRTLEQLRTLHGNDCYLVVDGSQGLWTMPAGMSEAEAIERYEHPSPAFAHTPGRAFATIVCVPGPNGRSCHRGWIRDGYSWDRDPESLRVERAGQTGKPKKRSKAMGKPEEHSEQWFDDGFHNMMQSALAAEGYKRQHKKVPAHVKAGLRRARNWLSALSPREYSSLIH